MRLGAFDDGKLYLELDFGDAGPSVTPQDALLGTRWEGMPYHVTLGPAWDEWWLERARDLVAQHEDFTLKLEKISPDRSRTAYAVAGGSVKALLTELEAMWFRPRGGAWHVSL